MTPAVPVSVANLIDGIIGLDNAPVAMPASQASRAASAPSLPDASRAAPTRQAVCQGAQDEVNNFGEYLPNQFATAYRPSDLYT